jgi:hypothetical protein
MLRKMIVAGVMMAHTVGAVDIAMLVDTSGSMQNRKEDLVRLMDKVWTYKYDISAFSFADDIRQLWHKKPYDIRIGGSTNLSGAVDTLVKKNKLPKVLVIMTDGVPNDNEKVRRAVNEVKRMQQVKICSVYVGNGKVPAILYEISDVVLQEAAIDMSLERCLQQPSIIRVLPQAPNVDMDNPYEI